jgi:hypothetical protein
MPILSDIPELIELAPRVIWFEEPELALRDEARFLVYLMTYGTVEDVITVQRVLPPDAFAKALQNAPTGIFDARSWSYWNVMMGRTPVPPIPVRFEELAHSDF